MNDLNAARDRMLAGLKRSQAGTHDWGRMRLPRGAVCETRREFDLDRCAKPAASSPSVCICDPVRQNKLRCIVDMYLFVSGGFAHTVRATPPDRCILKPGVEYKSADTRIKQNLGAGVLV